jgi:uncharacterized protein (TIGR02145 family)
MKNDWDDIHQFTFHFVVFNNLKYGSLSDIEDNTYKTISIGKQEWMAENLKTTKYDDGTAIPLVTDDIEWINLSTPACCWYNNDAAAYKATYGALYNWYAINTASNGDKNVCPSGWHVPNDDEWTILTDYLCGITEAGGKLKETGTTHWISPNNGATNETGFTGLPGGNRDAYGKFFSVGINGYWWSSTEYSREYAMFRSTFYFNSNVVRGHDHKTEGYSVRCLRDEII